MTTTHNSCAPQGLSLVVTIVNRGYGKKIVALLNQRGVTFNYIFLGRGTATSEISDYLGLGEGERDVVLSSVNKEQAEILLDMLMREMALKEKGNGIAFALPIDGVGGPSTLQKMAGICQIKGGQS